MSAAETSSAARRFGLIGAVLGGTAVIAGAFGAHALKDVLEPDALAAFHTAARYQLIHAVVLLIPGLAASRIGRFGLVALVLGVILFSGSLYLLTLLDWTFMGPVTPLGGLSLIIGWTLLAVHFFQRGSARRMSE